ncbi:MAG: sulfur transferase domain-containing protein [Oligoflexales bacterium]
MRIFVLTVFSFLTLLACEHGKHHHHGGGGRHPIGQNVKIGKSLVANHYSDIYFSGQPSDSDLQLLKKQGFIAVINLRRSQEDQYLEKNERQKVAELGLKYENLPINPGQAISDNFIDSVTLLVKKHRGSGKILIHCSSGNRVGMWLGGHFYKDHKFSKQESMDLAIRLGLKKEKAIEKVENYLKKASE